MTPNRRIHDIMHLINDLSSCTCILSYLFQLFTSQFSYCGTPSACNGWLKCKSLNSNSGALPFSDEELDIDETQFSYDFRKLANCPEDATSIDDCELPADDDTSSSGEPRLSYGAHMAMAAVAGIGAILMN